MRILTALIMFFIMGGVLLQKEPESRPEVIKNAFEGTNLRLKSGDIVLRSGKGFISEMFRNTSVHQTKYSHAGVIVEDQGRYYVYHMLGSAENKFSGLRRDKLSDFCNSNENMGFAIYRYQSMAGKEHDLANYLKNLPNENLIFDEAFDLSSEKALYCTEMIYKSMLKTAGLKLPLSHVQGKSYVGIDDLYLNNESIKITEVFY